MGLRHPEIALGPELVEALGTDLLGPDLARALMRLAQRGSVRVGIASGEGVRTYRLREVRPEGPLVWEEEPGAEPEAVLPLEGPGGVLLGQAGGKTLEELAHLLLFQRL